MNGVAAQSMEEKGLRYKQNYGVELPRLKQIISTISPNHQLAQQLWSLKIRETMILATLLEPTNEFSIQNARNWLKDIEQIELVEQTSMNLFSKLPYAKSLAAECIFSENRWTQIIGLTTAARIISLFESEEIEEVLKRIVVLSDTEDYYLYRSISVCLARFCRKGEKVAELISKKFEQYKNSHKMSFRYIHSEISEEISFLYF